MLEFIAALAMAMAAGCGNSSSSTGSAKFYPAPPLVEKARDIIRPHYP